jgi:cytochrome c oxidase subunit 2
MLGWLPEDVSTYGARIDGLFHLIYIITLVTFVLVEGLLIVFIVRYRRQPGRRAVYSHGNTALEIVWTIVPAVILVFLGIVSNEGWREIKATIPETDMHVEVTGKQFNWEVRYAGLDGRFGTEDDVQFDNELRVPVNKKVRVTLKSRDVIHSFFLPNLRLKQDTVPGREIDVWFEATKVGKYEMPCAELCGFGHSGMKGDLYVETAADYERWATEKRVARVEPERRLADSGVRAEETHHGMVQR